MAEIIVFVVFLIIVLAACIFNWGPAVLEWYFDTLEEWREVIDEALGREE